jgi:hypothetical protein
MNEVGSSNAAEVVDGLPDVIIVWEDNGNGDEVMCVICCDKFKNGESAKQLACNHLYHSHCLLEWFSHKISCPICRDEVLATQRCACTVALFTFILCTVVSLNTN